MTIKPVSDSIPRGGEGKNSISVAENRPSIDPYEETITPYGPFQFHSRTAPFLAKKKNTGITITKLDNLGSADNQRTEIRRRN